jgi:hypothetical protein
MSFRSIGLWEIENNSLEAISTKRLKLALSFFSTRKFRFTRTVATRLG